MKVTRSSAARIEFHLGKREKRLLLDILNLYPCIPAAHSRLSKNTNFPGHESAQRLLDEALAEQRAENKKQLQSFLNDSCRFREVKGGFLFALSPAELEWLLQVVNDVRVGIWILLGSPEEKFELAALNEHTARQVWSMEIAGYFEMHLLEGLGARGRD